MLIVYTLAVLVSAALLFTVQPLVAKMLLPLLGGSPSVWNACMLFFQAVLLAGYAYAHFVVRRLTPAVQVVLHGTMLALAFTALPIGRTIGAAPPADAGPLGWLLFVLTVSIGLPLFALSATGPLLQHWFSTSDHADSHDPYFLYAASNLGSLGGLLAYPLVIEPLLGLASSAGSRVLGQRTLWSIGYAVYAGLVAACAVLMLARRSPWASNSSPARAAEPSRPVTRSQRLGWTLLAFVPSSMMLGTTQYISTDIAAVPLLWVIPLALYLVTFMLAFSRRRRLAPAWWSAALAVLAVLAAASFWGFTRQLVWLRLPIHLLLLFAAGMLCHGRLARERPAADRLTEFYLWVALGGVLGGVFNALVAPLAFDSLIEYPIVIVVACLFRPGDDEPEARGARARLYDLMAPAALALFIAAIAWALVRVEFDRAWVPDLLQIAVPCVLCLGLMGWSLRFALSLGVLFASAWLNTTGAYTLLHAERTFFGVHRVAAYQGPPVELADDTGQRRVVRVPFHLLLHGTTRHGLQAFEPQRTAMPTAYYHPSGPISQVFEIYGASTRRVGCIGLGAGALAAYGRAGQRFDFYEIDPALVGIATNPEYFTYLRDSAAETTFVIGDGRLSLGRAPDAQLDLLVLDAFSSDAVPVHLLTREAVQVYLRKLRLDGLLSIHVTNTYLDLVPVVEAIAADLGLAGCVCRDREVTPQQAQEGKDKSTWIVLARETTRLSPLFADPRWEPLPRPGRAADAKALWTDDYSNIAGALRLWRRN